MPSLTVRDIPLDVMERLRQAAAEEHRSINAEVVHWLTQTAQSRMPVEERAKLAADIRALRRAIFRRHGTGSDSSAIIRKMRNARARREP